MKTPMTPPPPLPAGSYKWGVRDCLTVTEAIFRDSGNDPPAIYTRYHALSESRAVGLAVRTFGSVDAGHAHAIFMAGAKVADRLPCDFVVATRRDAPGSRALMWLAHEIDGQAYAWSWDLSGLVRRAIYKSGALMMRIPKLRETPQNPV